MSGLIAVLLTNWFPTSLIGDKPKIKSAVAPNKATIQYVEIDIFPIFIFGKTIVVTIIRTNIDIEMINPDGLKELSTKGVFISGNNVKLLFKYDSALIMQELKNRGVN